MTMIKILAANTLLSVYFKYRQYKALGSKQNKASSEVMSSEEYSKAVAYNRSKCVFDIAAAFLDFLKDIYILKKLSAFYSTYLQERSNSNVLMIVAYFAANSLLSIPVEICYSFVLEAYYGFNKMTPLTYIKDTIIGFGITVPLTYGVFYVCIRLIESKMTHYYLYIWVFLCLFILLIHLFYPILIAPLFNKFTLLEESDLKREVHALANRVGFITDKILVMDGSRRSSHGNAYFSGIGKSKNIVFFDTILKQLSHEQSVAVLSHELGHWAKWHPFLLMCLSFLSLFLHLHFFSLVLNTFSSIPLSLAIIYYFYFANVASLPLKFLQNAFVRMLERQADCFSVSLGFGKQLHSALIALSKENKTAPVNDPLYSCLSYSHPPLEERLQLIENEMAKAARKEE